jgi:hypothetical protein
MKNKLNQLVIRESQLFVTRMQWVRKEAKDKVNWKDKVN